MESPKGKKQNGSANQESIGLGDGQEYVGHASFETVWPAPQQQGEQRRRAPQRNQNVFCSRLKCLSGEAECWIGGGDLHLKKLPERGREAILMSEGRFESDIDWVCAGWGVMA